MPDTPSVREQDLLLSGCFGTAANSSRAGFIPVPLAHVPTGNYDRIPFYLRNESVSKGDEIEGSFTLYRAENVPFTVKNQQRLLERGTKFLYIRMVDQARFKRVTESRLQDIAEDPKIAASEKSTIIYETSLELMNELLTEPDLEATAPRLEQVARAVTTLTINDSSAFSHLFAASHHDFYTATHMVNVATWMVPLAYAMGYTDTEELQVICSAGMLHDIGKIYVSEEILNKSGKLSENDWDAIKRHTNKGAEYLKGHHDIASIVVTVAGQHHEQLNGEGYPFGLSAAEIHPVSRICAVVDSFDAMTAFRPFKSRTMSVPEAMEILKKGTPLKYDSEVMEAWMGLLQLEEGDSAEVACDGSNSRRFPRQKFRTPGRVHIVESGPNGWCERPGAQVVAHNVSRTGLGFMSKAPIRLGETVHVYLQGEGYDLRCIDGEIVRCSSHKDNWHECGMRFREVQPDLDWVKHAAKCSRNPAA